MTNYLKFLKIGGVKIHNGKIETFRAILNKYLSNAGHYLIYTPNPEILLYAWRHPKFLQILNKADLAIPDGIGLRIASGFRILQRITGADMAEHILHLAQNKQERILCLIPPNSRSSKSAILHAIKKITPYLTVRVCDNPKELNGIKKYNPHVILVGLGFPKQEEWLSDHWAELTSVKIGMAVGGTFDFWTGEAKRAPKMMQKIGLEWFWRFSHEPKRWRRIFQAVFVFPFNFLIILLFKRNLPKM